MDQFEIKINLLRGSKRSQSITKLMNTPATEKAISELVTSQWNLNPDDFYLLHNGRLFKETCLDADANLVVVPRVLGGKGGFGSMLRAIGAQIEKTTNRDACRDLSGRRLRDINEEQRLKKWFEGQEEREQEREEQRQKKLEKLRKFQEGPELPKMDDPEYFKQREEIEDAVYAAVDAGFQAAKPKLSSSASAAAGSAPVGDASTELKASLSDEERSKTLADQPGPSKRAAAETAPQPKKKLKKLMLDEDLDSDSSDDSDQETTAIAKKN